MLLTPDQARFTSTHQTHQTSAQALGAMGNKPTARRDAEVCDIVIAAWRNGIADMSGREIQQVYEFQHSKRIDTSTIAGCLNRLVTAKRLERVAERPCNVTGFNIAPVRPVAHQVRL
jgi:hypothetical protein